MCAFTCRVATDVKLKEFALCVCVCNYSHILRSFTLKRVPIISAESLHVMEHTTPCRVQDKFNINEKKEVGQTVQLC